jgi:predicted RNA binding protein YcfA (HicA-like mRNA interferase family)
VSRLPRVKPRQVLAARQRAGFVVIRSKGSHHFLQHTEDPACRTVIAVHGSDLPEATLHDILKQAGVSREEFLRLLQVERDWGRVSEKAYLGEAAADAVELARCPSEPADPIRLTEMGGNLVRRAPVWSRRQHEGPRSPTSAA